jgi:hypothetical protein
MPAPEDIKLWALSALGAFIGIVVIPMLTRKKEPDAVGS